MQEINMVKITLQKSNQGWNAMFDYSGLMPNGVWLPIPFTPEADKEMVKADLRKRFPNALFCVKANSL